MIYVFSHKIKHIFVISSRTLLTSKKWNAPSAHIHVLLCINATKLLYYLKKCDSHTHYGMRNRLRLKKGNKKEENLIPVVKCAAAPYQRIWCTWFDGFAFFSLFLEHHRMWTSRCEEPKESEKQPSSYRQLVLMPTK